ncbi:alpha/beta hydrolase [Microbacterium sp. HD4P20]|uniref:alpha/beta hydrolase n=1 Tax=Microbacterium sp. HD4P20 TaxID=2864874 RepID=UPI001C6403D2|nr:alpha/beta hydrolase [Microbacterium sp. HD4P20]MCP2635487.1 alpha/beta hydrolase [Microbacterium sp. HD4P20]
MAPMEDDGIDAVRAMLGAKARPVGWVERRARIAEVGGAWPLADDIELEAVDAGGVPAEWSRAPGAGTAGVLLFLHGGGYCSGSIVSHRTMAAEAGRAAGLPTLAVDYRLAPEHPFPAAIDDATTAWEWLVAEGHRPGEIIVGGDSAGGGLSLALWQRLQRSGRSGPAGLWLVSPWTDLTLSGASMDDNDAVDPLLHRAYLAELAAAYLPADVPRDDPRVSPLFADLTGLPPTLVQVGTDETLLDDAVRLARAAAAAGADIQLHAFPRMIHAFPLWNAVLADARRALTEFGDFARARLR